MALGRWAITGVLSVGKKDNSLVMPNLEYIRWEWKQYIGVWFYCPVQALSLYLAAIFFGLTILHGSQLFRSERHRARNKPLRKKFYWDIGITFVSMYVSFIPYG